MNFGPKFQSVINCLYHTPYNKVSINGYNSKDFHLFRRTHQGCPLLPWLLFALCIEPLGIRSSQDVHGIGIGDITFKVSLFADDLVVYVSNPQITLPNLGILLNEFGSLSGPCQSKSILYTLNMDPSMSHCPCSSFSYKLPKDYWSYLEVKNPLYLKDLLKVNYHTTINSTLSLLKDWGVRGISWMERIQSFKTSISPKLLYLFWALPIFLPQSLLLKWQTS